MSDIIYDKYSPSSDEEFAIINNIFQGASTGSVEKTFDDDILIASTSSEKMKTIQQLYTPGNITNYLTVKASIDIILGRTSFELKESPFDTIIFNRNKKRLIEIDNFKSIEYKYSNKVYERLLFLNEVVEEENHGESIINILSLKGFKTFIENNNWIKYPEISITPDGNVRIQWQKKINYHLAIEFLSENTVKIVLFSPDTINFRKTARLSGKMSVESVFVSLSPYNVDLWLKDER